jgi:hypothetical protein
MGFKVNDGATYVGWSDRFAATVIDVSGDGKVVTIQADKQKLLNGMNSGEKDALHCEVGGFMGHVSGTQRYEYERNTEGRILKFSRRKCGGYYEVGSARGKGYRLAAGRSAYHDFNF